MKHLLPAVLLPLTLLPMNATAWTFTGTPVANIWVDRSANDLQDANVTVDSIRVHKCAGGYNTYNVDQALDLVNTLTVSIDAGDYCGVSVQMGTTMRIQQENGGFIVDYEEFNTSIELDGPDGTGSAALLPLEVIEGPTSGSNPRIYVDIN